MTHASMLPCPTCSGTGTDTHEDRHTETNRDTCRTCGGAGQIPARTGESAEASFHAPGSLALEPTAGTGDGLREALARVGELEAILQPFANIGKLMGRTPGTRSASVGWLAADFGGNSHASARVTVGDFLAAHAALEGRAPDKGQAAAGVEATGRKKLCFTYCGDGICTCQNRELTQEESRLVMGALFASTTEVASAGLREALGEPHCWVIPGRDTANDYGAVDAHCVEQGEMSRPLWSFEAIENAVAALAPQTPEAAIPSGSVGEDDATARYWKRKQVEYLARREGEPGAAWVDRLRNHFATQQPAPQAPVADAAGMGVSLDAIRRLLAGVADHRNTDIVARCTLREASNVLADYRDEADAILADATGHWSAWQETEADSDPSDPMCGYSTAWMVGWWHNGAPDADCTLRAAGETQARAMAADLNRLLTARSVAALASPQADPLKDACEPWARHVGDAPSDDSPLRGVFDAGMDHSERLLAKLLGVTFYEGGDGSEDFDNDATMTLVNILAGAGLWDKDENRPLASPQAERLGEGVERAAADTRALADTIKLKMDEPCFRALAKASADNTTKPGYLLAFRVRPTGTDSLIVRLASGRDIIVGEDEWVPVQADATEGR